MLDRIIRFSLNNRAFIIIAAILLLIGGIYTARTMEVDVFPDLNAPTVTVMTEAGGMAPEEIEQLVTFPIETAMNGAAGVRRVRSSSTTGFSVVWVEFDWDTDIYIARQIVSEKISQISESLPPAAGNPVLGPQSSILGEMMIVGMTSETTSMRDLRTMAEWTVRPRLLSLGGVAQVAVLGGEVKEYQIKLSPEKMSHYNVSLSDVLEATADINRNASGGSVYQYGNEYLVRGIVSTSDMSEIGRTSVKYPITLDMVATIEEGDKTPKTGTASYRTQDAVLLTVTKQPNVSTLELTGNIDAAIADLQANVPSDVHFHTDIFRQQSFIDSSIGNIKKSLLEGALFVIIVLLIFLMNVRTTMISIVTIPLSLLISILTLRVMGLTINTMSIGGMAIAIGSLVDDAIVDVENVYKRLRENRLLLSSERRSIIEVVFGASREVRLPILNSTFIIVVSFVPLFFLSGMEGRMLKPLGVAFITSLFASTLVALTLTPVLCSLMLGRTDREDKIPFLSRWLQKLYEPALKWVLSHKIIVLGAAGSLLIAALAVFFTLGSSFLPAFNEGSLTINVSTLPGISLEESDRIGRMAEELILTVPEVNTVARKTGRAELDEHALGINTSEMEVPFTLHGRPKAEFVEEIRNKLSTLPGTNIEIGQPISHRIDAMLSGTQSNIAIKLFGDDLNLMYDTANEIKEHIESIEGLVDLNVEQLVERPQLQIVPRREMLAKHGITPERFAQYIEVYLEGLAVSQVYEGNRVFDLTLKADAKNSTTLDDIRNIKIHENGVDIPFGDIAQFVSTAGPGTINRENVSRKIVISANVEGRDLVGAVNDIKETIGEEMVLPEGWHIEYGGQFESATSASRTLMFTSLLAILVIFLLLYSQFRNGAQAVTVLLNLPLALIGGVFAIKMSGGIISIPAIIGFISLFGIATRNGMLLIDRYNDLNANGMTMTEAVMKGSLDRLNPILMTALTSALALIPLALGGSLPGNEIQSPMAKVMLGGLLTSTFLNGFVIPIMYTLISGKKK